MTDHAPHGDDSVLPFQLDRSGVRGRAARLDAALEAIFAHHNYPTPVAALVADAALLTALIGPTIKLRWRLSIQVRGQGPVRLIATDYFAPDADGAPARIRAYAGYDRAATPDRADTPFALLGEGLFALTIDQGPGMQPYQGVTPLTGGALAACAETHFAQSEQIATRFRMAAAQSVEPGVGARWRAGGVMLQHMPETSSGATQGGTTQDLPPGGHGLMTGDHVAAMGVRMDGWRRAALLLDTVEEHELIGPLVSPEALLTRLFHEEIPRVFPPQTVAFGCTCSSDKVSDVLTRYSREELARITDPLGAVTADCQFCGRRYTFDPQSLGGAQAGGDE